MSRPSGGHRPLWGLVLVAALLAGACSDDGGSPDASTVTPPTAGSVPEPGAPPADAVGDPYTPESGATGYDVAHYDLDLAWAPDDHELTGVATIEATAQTRLDHFSLDLLGFDVGSVTVDGDEAVVRRSGRNLQIQPAEPVADGDDFTVVVRYAGEPQSLDTLGFPTGWITLDDGTAFVIGEPDGGASWFPSNDHPSDKATAAVRVTAPEGWTVASNGELGDREERRGEVTWSWSDDDPIATYLLTLAIGHFEMVEDETDQGLALVSFLPEDDADAIEAALGDTGDMIEAFEERFGPYPFDSYGVIVTPVALGLALETQTRSLFGIDVIGGERFRAHELAHQWFGDAVTPSRWEDTWLNEGFASYAEYLWAEASDPGYDIDDAMREIYDPDGLAGSVVGPAEADWFGPLVYDRGALTLHALRREVGDEDFFTILQRWVQDHEYANATTDELVALAEEVSGRDLGSLFDAWLVGPELPPFPD